MICILSPDIYCQADSTCFSEDTLKVEFGWDLSMFEADKDFYVKYKDELATYPLTLSAFPVKEYEYAVYSESSPFYQNGHTYIKVGIGDYPDFNSDSTHISGTLIFQVDSSQSSENTFLQSRNYPYLTAQGTFMIDDLTYDWVFIETPEHDAYFMVNMKLFDLKFGKNILIFPNSDGSFTYRQFG